VTESHNLSEPRRGDINEQNVHKPPTHVVFSTKDREPLIVTEFKEELYAYLGGLTRELKGKAYGINGTTDHIHMLLVCRRWFRRQTLYGS
jgi:REP element-mobilizing transposase RayT